MMIQLIRKSIRIGLITCLAVGCGDMGSDDSATNYLARVGSDYLTVDEARKQINKFALAQDSAKAMELFREQWIQRQLILQEANNLQLSRQPEIRDRLEKAQNEVLINGVKDAISARYKQQTRISNKEALQYYRQHKQQLVLNERYVQFRHVENNDISKVRTARQYLQNDSSWVQVARQYSINPEDKIEKAAKFWPVSSLFNDFSIMKRYVSTLDSGQVSPIQRNEDTYHFIQLNNVRAQGETADPEWFVDQLREWLIREKQRKYYYSYVKNLYFKAKENNEIELFNVSTSNINDNIDSTDIH